MFEKVSRLAEQAATSVSRRQFLGRLGGAALTASAVLGGFLAFPAGAGAARRKCSSDADCPTGQTCRNGRCSEPLQTCDATTSVPECAGKLVGSTCGVAGGFGMCYGAPSCLCGNPKPGKGNGNGR